LQKGFAAASKEFGVPEKILLAVSYDETRWEQHNGEPSTDGGYGVMHLTDLPPGVGAGDAADSPTTAEPSDGYIPATRTLLAAAAMIGVSPDALKTDPIQNVRGGAAVLARFARDLLGSTPTNEADWYGVVARYFGSPDRAASLAFADTVFDTIQRGVSAVTSDGQVVTLEAEAILPNKDRASAPGAPPVPTFSAECPPDLSCDVKPAGAGHVNLANRPSDGVAIRYIVIHDTEASYSGTLRVFQAAGGIDSAHYVVRSSDGHVTQVVQTKNIARHAGNWYFNSHSIGVEHEGYAIQGATWYSEPLYQASAKLVRFLAEKYNIPLDRAHILGHDNIPGQSPTAQGQMHWDPGPFWDWDHYMELLGVPITRSSNPAVGQVATIDPAFAANQPITSQCDAHGCSDLPRQSASFVFLRTAPQPDAPLIADPTLQKPGKTADPGTTKASDWGDKAATGEQFYLADRQGDWSAIYFAGQKAWFYDPASARAVVASAGTLVRPKAGLATIPVFGQAYPEASAYPAGAKSPTITPLPYSIPAGQTYVGVGPIPSDFARPLGGLAGPDTAPIVKGNDDYYQIFFNHRVAFVRAADVEVVS
jgi:N-acetyl-anhydromuramyl-L-alanine amidase AmpD